MTEEVQHSREIDGKGRTVRELLANRKYSIDYYQREYKWQTKQLSELMADLSSKFIESYDPAHDRDAIDSYGHYFLGSIIISDKGAKKFIIDGQQRLTTLTLLLIYLRHHLEDDDQRAQLSDLIFSLSKGKRSFNLEVPERISCMEALYANEEFVSPDQEESVANILARFADLDDVFPDELRGPTLPYFCDWLIDNVNLVEITAYSDGDAYTIFETMNDRGLSLTPADMLKGYLLANITNTDDRVRASKIWKDRTASLVDVGKDEDADGIKSWLRSQYAANIRDRKKGAAPEDFDKIGTEFHRWVRDNERRLQLDKSSDFVRFIERDFLFYSQWYERLRKAAITKTEGLESIYFNAEHNFTLQYPVLLAPITIADSEELALRKVKVTAAYLDILINRRIWNWHATDYSTVQYSMFLTMRDVRGKSLDELVALLLARLDAEEERFSTNGGFRLHGTNGRALHRILARMTEFIELGSGMPSRYTDYAKRGGKDAFEIEHIWADHPERHEDEFGHPSEFAEYRNRVGDLLLLPKSFNASFGDMTYEEKLPHYNAQNLLARSLHPKAYEKNPGFLRFIEQTGLPFGPVGEFKKADLDARQALYGSLAELIWNPGRLSAIADTSVGA